MQIVINGEVKAIEDPCTLAELLVHLGIEASTTGIAVAVNETVIRRVEWDTYLVQPNDRLEIVQARQGG